MGRKRGIKKVKKPKVLDLKYDHDHFFNRDLSWLEFNSRVLNEAADKRTPLLERCRFLSIFTNNLDEFVMKRVGGLKRQSNSEYNFVSVDGKSAAETLDKIREVILLQMNDQEKNFDVLVKELSENNIHLLTWEKLTEAEMSFCNEYFLKNIFPILTPLSVDPGKPFPFISNLSFSLGIYLEHPYGEDKIFSRVKVPQIIHNWIPLGDGFEGRRLINTSEIIINNLHHLFRGMKIVDVMTFRVTRNADWEHDDEDTEDLLELIEESINERRLQEPIRIECTKKYNPEMLSYLMDEMNLSDKDVYFYRSQLDYYGLDSVADLNFPKLKYKDWRPVNYQWFNPGVNIFDQIKQKDRLVHHPYESFSGSVEKFISDAARDPNVLSIKMTLYRTGDNSPFIKALIDAAENGKQVVCLIELKARFDEKRNISGAQQLEEAGVHVVYGIVGLKTHTKISLVVRKESNGELLRYAHIGTGNYNPKTARIYTDIGLLTVDSGLTSEVSEVFNYLTGSSLKVDYDRLLLAPVNAKSTFLKKIWNQTKKANEGKKVKIVAKMNALEDVAIIEALYEASRAGVQIFLIVRGFCCLRPGVAGLSENIKVISIIGRFLEHSRIFFFSDGESDWGGEYFIGSADWMHRNLHSRVEVMTPIYSEDHKQLLANFFKISQEDQRSAWILGGDGKYTQLKGDENSGSHDAMMKFTMDRLKASEAN